jgi:hypothetical protein
MWVERGRWVKGMGGLVSAILKMCLFEGLLCGFEGRELRTEEGEYIVGFSAHMAWGSLTCLG